MYSLRPVTASSASTRLWPTPITRNALVSFSCTSTAFVVTLAAFVASSPYVTLEPSGAWITPPRARRLSTVSPSTIAAASSSAALATAAATRIGV